MGINSKLSMLRGVKLCGSQCLATLMGAAAPEKQR